MDSNYINYFNEFEREYEVLKNASDDVLSVSLEIIKYIEIKLKELFKWLKKYVFDTIQEEIYFFKELKPRMVSKLLFYNAIVELETTLPLTKKNKIKHYEKYLSEINQFSGNNQEIYKYYRSRKSNKDEEYFVRRNHKILFHHNCCLINNNVKICTCHDHNFATIISNKMLAKFLEKKLDELNGLVKDNSDPKKHKFNWTATKVDLTEMVYGFQATGSINNGNFDLKELAVFLGTMFNVEIDSNLYGHYSDIKSRKVSKTRFINTMSDKLIEKMDDEDSKKKP
jgi:hypothetical protein